MATKPNDEKENEMSVHVKLGMVLGVLIAVVGATVFITKAEGTGTRALEMARENRESQKTIVATLSKIVQDQWELSRIQKHMLDELKEMKGDVEKNERTIEDISKKGNRGLGELVP